MTYIWDEIKNDPRPKVLYGRGNGADKIFAVCEKENITIDDCAVSDGYAREGQTWLGKQVLSLSEACEKYESCVFIVAFATREGDVIDRIKSLEPKHSVFIPDVPVTDGELFSEKFYQKNAAAISEASRLFADDISRQIFENIIKYKLSGKIEYLENAVCNDLSFIDFSNIRVAVDCGAYDGDTLRELYKTASNLKKAYAVEPDRVNFRKLSAYAESEKGFEILPINCAIWKEDGETEFFAGGNRGSSIFYVGYKAKRQIVPLRSIDSLCENELPNYIKFDTEGAESEALDGSIDVIRKCRPILKVSAYHRSEDIFTLTKKIASIATDYKIYLRRNRCIPAWEAELYAVPN